MKKLGNVIRREIPAALAVALALAVPGVAGAAVIDMNWDSCTGPVNLNVLPQQPVRLWVSTIGPVEAHRAYEFRIQVEGDYGYLPDAWRFDVGGCQDSGGLQFEFARASAKACPPFNDEPPKWVEASYDYVFLNPNSLGALIRFRVEYPARLPDDPGQRRHLGIVTFDHTYSVNGATTIGVDCGEMERGVCLSLLPDHCNYTKEDGPGTVIPFSIGNGVVSVYNHQCAIVPAARSTWGGIKSVYRR